MPEAENEADIEVRTYFARGRNALVARGDFSGLYAAWYLHRLDNEIQIPPEAEEAGREALAALTLHCAGRPWNEAIAWTIQLPEPRANIFVAGENTTGTVVANLQASGLEPIAKGMFHSDVVVVGKPQRRSVVDFQEGPVLRAVEDFYSRSEQRPVRFFWHGDEDLVMVAAQPDCDFDWLAGLTDAAIRTLDRDVELSLLEKRNYSFRCGCNQERMLDLLLPVFRRQADELFHGDPTLTVVCPRCGQRHVVTREALEARGDADEKGM